MIGCIWLFLVVHRVVRIPEPLTGFSPVVRVAGCLPIPPHAKVSWAQQLEGFPGSSPAKGRAKDPNCPRNCCANNCQI